MTETAIRPSMRFIKMGYAAVILLLIAAFVIHYEFIDPKPMYLPGVVALFLLWPLSRQIRRHFTKLTISGDKLYHEVGAISKQTRIIQIPKIQDVRVHQGVGQRMFGVGDLSIETAGEASRLTVANLDNPRALAEQILELAHHDHGRPQAL